MEPHCQVGITGRHAGIVMAGSIGGTRTGWPQRFSRSCGGDDLPYLQCGIHRRAGIVIGAVGQRAMIMRDEAADLNHRSMDGLAAALDGRCEGEAQAPTMRAEGTCGSRMAHRRRSRGRKRRSVASVRRRRGRRAGRGEAGRASRRAQRAAMARSAEPGASAVVVAIGKAGERGAGTKCRAATRETDTARRWASRSAVAHGPAPDGWKRAAVTGGRGGRGGRARWPCPPGWR